MYFAIKFTQKKKNYGQTITFEITLHRNTLLHSRVIEFKGHQAVKYDDDRQCPKGDKISLFKTPLCLRGCLPKILKPILDYITDFLKTFCVIYTLVG